MRYSQENEIVRRMKVSGKCENKIRKRVKNEELKGCRQELNRIELVENKICKKLSMKN